MAAKFRYRGEPQFAFVKKMGKTLEIRIPTKHGKRVVFKAPNANGFVPGSIIDAKDLDVHALRMLRADPRFEEIVS
jgi:hypothetical protein